MTKRIWSYVRKHPAFTLIEMTMVVALFGAISAMVIPLYSDFKLQSELYDAVELTVQGLGRAKVLSQSGEGNSPSWGFHAPTGTLYKGTSYDTRDASADELYAPPSTVAATGLLDVSFTGGVPNAVGTIMFTSITGNHLPVEIEINEEGIVANKNDQFTICHCPPGQPGSSCRSLAIPQNAWPAHKKHCATTGECDFTGPCSGLIAGPTDTTPPVVSAVVAGIITQSTAPIEWTTNEPADSQIVYGTTNTYGNFTTLDASLVTTHNQVMSSLTASTLYHYYVKSTDAAGNLSTSGDYTLTTLPADVTPPSISGVASSMITTTSARILWTTDEPADSQVEYGLTAAYGNSTPLDTSMFTTHGPILAGLSPGTLYHYRVRSRDAAGNLSTSGDYTFTTLSDTTPPVITTVGPVGIITQSSALIPWTTNEPADSQVEYGTTVAYGNFTTLDTSLVTTHNQVVSGLTASTLYHYRVRSRDAAGNLSMSGDNTFTTAAPPSVTTGNLSPIADGSISEAGWLNPTVDCSTLDCYTAIDDPSASPDDDTTRIQKGTQTNLDITFDLAENTIPDGSTITAIAVTFRCARTGGSNGSTTQANYRVNGGALNTSGTNFSCPGNDAYATTTQTFSSLNIAKNASTDLEVGVTGVQNRAAKVTMLYAVITYTAP